LAPMNIDDWYELTQGDYGKRPFVDRA